MLQTGKFSVCFANIGFDTAESEPSVGGFIREVLHDVHQIIQHRAPVDRRGALQLAGEQSPTFVGCSEAVGTGKAFF